MLESIPVESLQTAVYRLASYREDEEFMERLGLDQESQHELMDLLESQNASDSVEALLDGPFRPKPRLKKTGYRVSRFSDGSFPVFYCATEAETAKAEVRHHRTESVSDEFSTRYTLFRCDFDGSVKDLRRKKAEWSELTYDTDYRFCNELGFEALKTGLDGLLAPSVRRVGGTNIPVFKRSAISNPRDLEEVTDL